MHITLPPVSETNLQSQSAVGEALQQKEQYRLEEHWDSAEHHPAEPEYRWQDTEHRTHQPHSPAIWATRQSLLLRKYPTQSRYLRL